MTQEYIYNLGLKFHKVAKSYSGNVAIRMHDGETTFTYEALEMRSNQIAHFFLGKGVSKGQTIGLFNHKTFEGLATMLAALKIGVTYTNLDYNSPKARLEKMLLKCRPSVLIHDAIEVDEGLLFPNISCLPLLSETIQDEIEKCSTKLPETTHDIHGETPAYIMFTSGSTGFPKGVVITHQNVLNLIQWSIATFSVTPEDRLSNVNPIYFDNSVFDFYTALFSGASLLPIPIALSKDARSLVSSLEKSQCTLWFSVPSLLIYLLTTKAIQAGKLSSLRAFIFGGEGFPKPKLKQLYEFYKQQAILYNVYGPTECTCICSSYIISEKDFENIHELAPLGKLAPNFGYHIRPIETDNILKGELYLTGPQVGKGYINDKDRTEQSFITDTLYAGVALSMYCTGDLVERRKDGLLYFLGRVDNQIKHMGYRIELEEIEAALNTLAEVKEAAALYQNLGNGIGRICVFVAGEIESATVLQKLKQILPQYMLPSKINVQGLLPKNANGKINRNALKQQL